MLTRIQYESVFASASEAISDNEFIEAWIRLRSATPIATVVSERGAVVCTTLTTTLELHNGLSTPHSGGTLSDLRLS